MKKIIFILLVFIVQAAFAKWEKTNWKNDGQIYNIWVSGNTVIAGLIYNGFIISTDLGDTWQTCNNGLPADIGAHSLLIDRNNIYLGAFGSLYASTDLGKSWDRKFKGLPDFPIAETIAVLGNTIIAGAIGDGIYISTDEGNSWQQKNNGLGSKIIFTIAVAGNNILAGTGKGVFLSTDTGNTWILKNNGLDKNMAVKTFLVIGNNIFAVMNIEPTEGQNDLYVSTDMGENWVNQNNKLIYETPGYSLNVIGNNLLLSVGNDLLYISTDMGINWNTIQNGLPSGYALFPVTASGYNLFAVRNCDIYLSTDMGSSWIIKKNPLNYGRINTIKVSNNNIFVGCQLDPLSTYQNGLFVSSDMGNTWESKNWHEIEVRLLAVKDKNILASTPKGVYLLTDLSGDWVKRNLEFYIYSLSFFGNNIFAGTGYGVYSSSDMGMSWYDRNNGFKDSIIQFIFINDNYQLAGTNHGIYFSSDMCETWQAKNNGLPQDVNVFSIAMIDNNMFIGTYDGLFKSTDNGESWVEKTKGLPDEPYILTLFVVGNNIFAGDDTYGVFLSTDKGETWTSQNDGLLNLNIGSFAVLNDYLFVSVGKTNGSFGLNGPALYKSKLSDFGVTDIAAKTEEKSNTIFPNPASDYIYIQLSEGLKPSEGSNIQIFDMLGTVVATIHPMTTSHRMNIENLAPGMYFIKIGNRVEKFVKK